MISKINLNMIGQTVLHYKIIEKIGTGGMGVIYKAEETRLDRLVALKFLPFNLSGTSEKKRFVNEAKALAALNHPNVAVIYGFEEHEGKAFIVMEYVEGCDLRRILTAQKSLTPTHLPLEKIIDLTRQLICGLKAAHNKLMVHRDIKPENIIVNSENHLKILDFGLATMAGKELLTKTSTTMGTVAYMAPEQTRGETVDNRTDIWAAGVILYEMLTGNRPFRGDYEQAVIYSILNEDPEPPRSFNPDVPVQLEKIVLKALAKKPVDRYNNCEEFLKELEFCLLPEHNEVNGERKSLNASDSFSPGNITGYLRSAKKQLKISWKIIVCAAILFAAGLYLFYPEFQNPVSYGKKIAVLPFISMSNNPNDEYFNDGIMEDVLTQLAKIRDLKVISRTTMMRYKNTDKSIEEISSELNTDIILEGSVRRNNDQLRVTVQLIDAKTDEHIWAESYDRSLKDVFEVQSQIAYQIALTLHAELSSSEKKELEKVATINLEAYNAYLQGRFFLDRRTAENVDKAISYFKYALELDSSYANAWVALSKAHGLQADMGIIPLDEGYYNSRVEAEKALKLNPDLAEAYATLGWIKMTYEWDWSGADAAYQTALKLEPGNAGILQSAGVLLGVLGRLNEAIELIERAIELNPLLSTPNYNLSLHYYYAHQWDKAIAAARRVLELNPGYPAVHSLIGRIYLAQSKPEEALLEMQKETENTWRSYGLILTYRALGNIKKEDKALKEFMSEYGDLTAFQIAEIYSYRGDPDSAFIWLERAYKQRDGGLSDMKGDPLLDNIKKDPRYSEFMKKMNLPL